MLEKPGDIDYLAMFLEKVDKTGNNVSGTETQNKKGDRTHSLNNPTSGSQKSS